MTQTPAGAQPDATDPTRSRLGAPGKLRQDVLWNLVSLAVVGVAGILLNILVGRFFGAAALGVFGQTFAAYIIFSQFAAGGVHLSTLRHVAQQYDDPAVCRLIVRSALLLTLLLALPTAGVYWLARGPMAWLQDSPDLAVGIAWSAPGLFCFAINKTLLAVLNGLRHMRAYAVAQALRYVGMIAALGGLIAAGWPGRSVAVVLSAAEALLMIVLLALLRRQLWAGRSGPPPGDARPTEDAQPRVRDASGGRRAQAQRGHGAAGATWRLFRENAPLAQPARRRHAGAALRHGTRSKRYRPPEVSRTSQPLPAGPLGLGGWMAEHLRFGVRGFGSGVIQELNTRVDVLLLGYFWADALVGVYHFAATLVEGIAQLGVAVRANVNPIAARLLAGGQVAELEQLARRSRRVTYVLMAVVAVVTVALYPLGLGLVSDPTEFGASWPIFAILMAGLALSAGYLPMGQILLQAGRPGLHTLMSAAIVLFNAAGNLALIPVWRELGSAWATAASYVFSAVLIRAFAWRAIRVRV